MSALRSTRTMFQPRTSMPVKSRCRKAPITSSIGTKRPSPISRKRGRLGGTLTRAKRPVPLTGSARSTASERLPPEMKGKGCAGSTTSGVRTGRIMRSKCSPSSICSASVSESKLTMRTPAAVRAGRSSRIHSSSVAWRIAAQRSFACISCAATLSPSTVRRAGFVRSRRCSQPIRFS